MTAATIHPSSSGQMQIDESPTASYTPEFRRRRATNWLTLGMTYAVMYFGRYNFSFVNKALSDAYGWSKADVGRIITTAGLVYGLSAIFNGPIADKFGGRRAMLIGACGSVVFNFFFGLGAYLGFLGKGPVLLAYFMTIWGMAAYFQSYSALAIVKVNAGWFHIRERGVFSAIFGAMIQAGRALVFVVGPIVVTYLPWQGMFFIPSIMIAVMAYLTWRNVQNSPEEAGLKALDVQDASSGDTEPVTVKYVLKKILTNPITLTIAAAEFCTGLLRHGFEQWFPRYMQEYQKLPLNGAIFKGGALGVVLAGILGAMFAGTISDWVFKGRRPPVAFIGYMIIAASLGVISMAPSITWVMIAFTTNSFAISMVHSMLSGTASMDFGGRKAAGTATGVFDGMQYLAGSVVGVGMGWMLDKYGWGSWGPSMVLFAVIGGILMAVIWNARPHSARGAH